MRASIAGMCTLAMLAVQASAAERWRSQYFYDTDAETLVFADMQCPSNARCLAVGSIIHGRSRKPVAIVTSDSGKTWSTVKLEQQPVSLFFLNEGLGWMVSENSDLWETTEAGRNWKKVGRVPAQATRVFFRTENDGWAAAGKKSVLETHDGGRHWTAVPAAGEPPGDPRFSAYTWIAFAGQKAGLITGWNIPPHREPDDAKPEWIDPQSALRRTRPHLSYSLTTADGGKTWRAASGSLFGEVARVRLQENGVGLNLMQYPPGFRYPSEVYKIDLRAGKSETAYRDRNLRVTDIWVAPGGAGYVAGRSASGQAWNLTPGKVRILRSADWLTWVEQAVDYRAVANTAILAGSPEGSMWAATDTGMILKLLP